MIRAIFHAFLGFSAIAKVCAANYYFDLNGSASGSGAVSGSYAWSGSWWSGSYTGTTAPGALPIRNSAVFSAGNDGFAANLTITGSSGEMASVIVEEGNVTIQTLTRIFVGNSSLKTAAGTSLTIQNSPDFYNNTVYLETAENSTISLGGAASGVRNAKLVKTGGGLAIFNGANTGSSGGKLTVDSGEFRLRHADALPNGITSVNAGGTLSLSNEILLARGFTLAGGTLRNHDGTNTCLGAVNLSAASRLVAAGGSLNLSPASGNAVSGAFPLTVSGDAPVAITMPLGAGTGLVVAGPGTVTLSAASPTSGAVSVSGGTLRLTEAGGALGSVGGSITLDGTLEVANDSARTFGNALSGGGNFIKQGGGVLDLTASSAFSGTVRIDSGTLRLAPAATLAASRIETAAGAVFDVSQVAGFTLGSGQTLSGTGTVAGALAAADGSVIDPGLAETPGTLSFGNPLTWSGGVTAVLDLATTPAGSGDRIAITGNLALTGANTLRVRYTTLANGTYPLIRTTGGTVTGDLGSLQLAGFLTLSQSARLQLAPGGDGIDLIVEDYIHTPRDLVWTGDGAANLWQNGGATVWLANGQPADFAATDRVLFDANGAANPVVTLSGDLVPGSVTVNATNDFTFSGAGCLLGPAGLLKSGNGRLVITGDHAFTGGANISQGSIEVRSSAALGSGVVENSGTLAFAASQPMGFANPVSGSGGLVHLSGETTITAANAFTGPVTISGGTLHAGHPSAFGDTNGSTTVAAGATLDLAGTALAAESVSLAGGILRNSSASEASLAGPLTLANATTLPADGPLALNGGLHGAANLNLEGTLTLAGASTRTGGLTVSTGGNLLVTGNSGPGAIAVASGATLRGSGTLGGPVTVAGSLETGSAPSTLAFAGDLTLQATALTRLRIVKSSGSLVADRLQVAGTLARAGELVVSISGEPLVEGDVVQLIDASGGTGSFAKLSLPILNNDLIWDTVDFDSAGILRVIKLPAVSTIEQRREWLLGESLADPGAIDAFVMAAACFAVGEDTQGMILARGRSETLVEKIRSAPVQVDLFDMWPAVDLCVRFGNKLDTETLSNIREATTIFTQYKDTNTSNLQTLAWVTRYLAGQLFGEEAFTSLGIANYWRTTDPNAAQQLLTNLNDCTRLGFREHASRPYYAKNLQPIASLAQLAADATMRQRAALAYEAGLAQNAASWLRGHLGSPTTRSYPDVLSQLPIGGLGVLWYHFGGNLPPRNNEAAVLAAVMNQPVSPILEIAASDRTNAFTSRSFLRNAHHSAYVDPDYILFSDGPRAVGDFQVYPNGVVWAEPDTSRYSFLWVAKPYRDDSGINSSNPHGRNLFRYKETQARDATLYIYDIPSGDAFPYALGYVPGGYRAMVNDSAASGHVFLHYGTVLIAIRSEIPFTWDPQSGIAFPASSPRSGDSEFRIFGTQFAVALETASPVNFPGASPADQLAAFRTAVLAAPAPARTADATPTASYTTRRGDALTLAFSADPATRPVTFNGLPVNYNTWPVLENPWMHQRAGDSLLTLFTPTRRELLDFSNWTRRIQTAPTVTAPATSMPVNQNASVDIDLTTLATAPAESTLPLRFDVGSASAGSVVLQADGRTARFTPAPGHRGPASFGFTARAAGVDPSRLVFLYDYEDDFLSNNWIADVSGHRLTGIVSTTGSGTRSLDSETPAALAGVSSRSLKLDESGNSAARFTHDVTLSEHDMSDADWTFATWARRASTTNHDMVLYFGSGDGFGGSGDELYLFFPAGSNTVRLHHYNASNALDLDLTSPATATAGAWHHLAVSFTRTGLNTGIVRLYLNGALAATSSPVTWAIKQSSPMVIGGNNSTSAPGPERWFNGRLDDSALFNRVLSESEVASLASQSVRHFTGLSASATVPLNVMNALDQWRHENFGTTDNTGTAADDADPDGDGSKNLLEYAFSTVPNAASSWTRPQLGTAADRLTITFPRTRSDLIYQVEGCSNLVHWQTIATNPGTVGQNVTVSDTVNISTADPPRRFLRLRVASQ
jgi:autotransporter-associated beta strand protein